MAAYAFLMRAQAWTLGQTGPAAGGPDCSQAPMKRVHSLHAVPPTTLRLLPLLAMLAQPRVPSWDTGMAWHELISGLCLSRHANAETKTCTGQAHLLKGQRNSVSLRCKAQPQRRVCHKPLHSITLRLSLGLPKNNLKLNPCSDPRCWQQVNFKSIINQSRARSWTRTILSTR